MSPKLWFVGIIAAPNSEGDNTPLPGAYDALFALLEDGDGDGVPAILGLISPPGGCSLWDNFLHSRSGT